MGVRRPSLARSSRVAHRKVQAVDVRDVNRSQLARRNLPWPAKVILNAVSRDDDVMVKALKNHDSRAGFEVALRSTRSTSCSASSNSSGSVRVRSKSKFAWRTITALYGRMAARRIALVVTGGVDRSGREKVIPALLWLIERLARQHDVFVYALRYHEQPRTYPLLGATVATSGGPPACCGCTRALLASLRHDGPFDIVHGYWALPAGLVSAAAARRLGVPSVVTCDSGEFTAIPEIDYGLQIRWRQRAGVSAALKLASRVTVCTAYMERLARAHGATPVVIPLGVDTGVFAPAPHRPGPPWRLLSVASLNPVKDHRTLIEAFRLVVDRMADVYLDLAGEDTMDGAAREAVMRRALADRVTFHGVLPSAEVSAAVPSGTSVRAVITARGRWCRGARGRGVVRAGRRDAGRLRGGLGARTRQRRARRGPAGAGRCDRQPADRPGSLPAAGFVSSRVGCRPRCRLDCREFTRLYGDLV